MRQQEAADKQEVICVYIVVQSSVLLQRFPLTMLAWHFCCYLLLALQATQAAVSPILHLRTVNPYLHSALLGTSHTTTQPFVQLPRQSLPWSPLAAAAPGAADSRGFSWQQQGHLLGGVSGFAFMGTNGHAMVAGPAVTTNTATGEASADRRLQCWKTAGNNVLS